MLPSGPAGERLLLEACVGEAARLTAEQARHLGLDVRTVAGLRATPEPAVRLAAKPARVPLALAARRMMQARLPAFGRAAQDPSEALRFVAPFAAGTCVFVDFLEDPPVAGGNGFSLRLGVAAGGPERPESALGFFELLGRRQPPSFRYASAEEREAALAAAGALLAALVPPFCAAAAPLLAQGPGLLPEGVECAGALTSREALGRAAPLVAPWAADARLDLLESASDPALREALGPGLSADGRLRPHARWTLRFTSRALREHLWVTVPALGPARAGAGAIVAPDSEPFLPQPFADSDATMAAAERAAAAELAAGPPLFDRLLRMPPTRRGDPGWIGVHFILAARPLRRDVRVRLRAEDAAEPEVESR